MIKEENFSIHTVFESNTTYIGTEPRYDIYPSDDMEEIYAWNTILNSGNIPLRAAFVLRGLKNVTVDLRGAKLVLHGRIMAFAAFDCEKITFKNFSIDYDRPFYTQGTVIEAEGDSAVIEIPELFSYRVESGDFIACAENWEHRLITGDMLFRCFDPKTLKPSKNSGVILGLIGDKIFPRENPPMPIHHLFAEDLGNRRVRISGLPEHFKPRVGEILAMTHEDRRKTGFLLERCSDTVLEHIRLIHIPAMGTVAILCHNITLNDYSMYIDEECASRVVSINADSFHTVHCTGLMKVENCRFENMLDDAINVHGNYLILKEKLDDKTLMVQNRSAGRRAMQYMLPGDEIVIYKGRTQEIRRRVRVKSAEYLPDQYLDMKLTLCDGIDCETEEGDCIEVMRMAEIEVRNCYVKCMAGFRISSGKRVTIEDCTFETAYFSVAFTGDMTYWFENTGVKDVTVKNCKFIECGIPLETNCGFLPTEKAPFYHENIKFINNEIINPREGVVKMKDVNNFVYKNNTVKGLSEDVKELSLENCQNTVIE